MYDSLHLFIETQIRIENCVFFSFAVGPKNSHFSVKALSLLNRNKLKSIGIQQGKSAHFQVTQMCIAWRKSLLPAHSVSRIRILH